MCKRNNSRLCTPCAGFFISAEAHKTPGLLPTAEGSGAANVRLRSISLPTRCGTYPAAQTLSVNEYSGSNFPPAIAGSLFSPQGSGRYNRDARPLSSFTCYFRSDNIYVWIIEYEGNEYGGEEHGREHSRYDGNRIGDFN
jgi:hypothetical protein